VFAEGPMELPVLCREAFDDARFAIPRQINQSFDAAVLAVNLKPFLEVAAHRDGQIEVAKAAIRKIDGDEPAIRPESLQKSSAYCFDFTPQESRRIDQMASMRQHEIAPLVRLRIPLRFAGTLTGDWNWLQIVGHCVAIRRIVVPRLETHALADFFP